MNSVFTNSARLVTGGVEFIDTRSVLRSVPLATRARTFSFIGPRGQKRQKGTTVAAVTGVVPTMTSDFNVILLRPFGARVTIGLSRGMNNPEREANALGNSKTQLRSIAGLFLCPANYHPELMTQFGY